MTRTSPSRPTCLPDSMTNPLEIDSSSIFLSTHLVPAFFIVDEGPGMIAETSVVQKLPLIKRLQSNALKNKREALEELLLLVKDDPRELKQYEELFPELLSFSHPSVVDKSLKILNIYLQSGSNLSLDPKIIIKIAL